MDLQRLIFGVVGAYLVYRYIATSYTSSTGSGTGPSSPGGGHAGGPAPSQPVPPTPIGTPVPEPPAPRPASATAPPPPTGWDGESAARAAANGNASAVAWADSYGVRWNVDQWNWFRVAGGGAVIPAPDMEILIAPGEDRSAAITASEYLARLARLPRWEYDTNKVIGWAV